MVWFRVAITAAWARRVADDIAGLLERNHALARLLPGPVATAGRSATGIGV
jgi:hypothetical protein